MKQWRRQEVLTELWLCSSKLFVSLCVVKMGGRGGASNSGHCSLSELCSAAHLFGASSSNKIPCRLIRSITCYYGIGKCSLDHFYQQYNSARNKLWKPRERLSILVFSEKYQL